MKKSLTKSHSGFTLVETLVAVSILVVGVIGPLSLAARGISDGLFAQNQLTANLLAQEAMETIINQRNSNILSRPTTPFADIWDGPVGSEVLTVGVDPVSGDLSFDCTDESSGGCYLNDNPGDDRNFYERSKDGKGPFLRQITISKISDQEIKVEVTISWKNKTVDKHFTISEYLYAK